MNTRQLSFYEKVDAVLRHLEIAKIETVGSKYTEAPLKNFVNKFCVIVCDALSGCLKSEPCEKFLIQSKIDLAMPDEDAWRATSCVFQLVELVECRLFNANSLFGLSRNTIAAHFQHEYEKANGYSFSWMIKFCDINNPDDYPTIESALQDVQIRDECIDMESKTRRLADCAAEPFNKAAAETPQY